MNLTEKGWLKDYLELRIEQFKDLPQESKKSAHPEHSLYHVLQPTGLMYGQSVTVSGIDEYASWNSTERMKVLLAENLVVSSLLFHKEPMKSHQELSEVITMTLEKISIFYTHVFPEIAIPSKTLFGRKKTPIELVEKILDKRVGQPIDKNASFWVNFFQNSLLFLDIYIFGQWIHTNADLVIADFFKYEREELRFSVVKVMAAAAHANAIIEPEEKILLDFFLQGANLNKEQKNEAAKIFEKGADIDEINLQTNNSWILKKYFLEIAILTIWSDKQVESKELEFLKKLCSHLYFSDDDLENSMIAVEGFILEHWDDLGHLQNNKDYSQISDSFVKRVSKITDSNKNRLEKEIKESRGLLLLFRKLKNNELNDREKEEMKKNLIAVLQTIPTFLIISLPQRFLTLPKLLKILPSKSSSVK